MNIETKEILSVIMPVFNEELTLVKSIQLVLSQKCVKEVVVVDDGSTDKSAALITSMVRKNKRIKLIKLDSNHGKGYAISRGIMEVTGNLCIIQDADLEYSPNEYERLIKPIKDGRASVVFGSRFLGSGEHRVLYFWHYLGNKILTTLSNMFTNLNLSDMETCYKIGKTECFKQLNIQEKRFGIEPEITAKFAKMKVPIYEIPISYYGRTYEEGKKIGWRDGIRAIYCIIKYNMA
jgi:glycosyltransferase involved in cell wall biosynthesis